jgi:hypothetical protein
VFDDELAPVSAASVSAEAVELEDFKQDSFLREANEVAKKEAQREKARARFERNKIRNVLKSKREPKRERKKKPQADGVEYRDANGNAWPLLEFEDPMQQHIVTCVQDPMQQPEIEARRCRLMPTTLEASSWEELEEHFESEFGFELVP